MKDGMSEYDSPHKPHKLPWECVNSRPLENQRKGCAYGERVRMAGMKNQLWRCWSAAKDGWSGASPSTNPTRHGKQAEARKMIRHKLKWQRSNPQPPQPPLQQIPNSQ
jgi:hypothetical protein